MPASTRTELPLLRADFHNHSCLSPCGSLEMSPSRLVAEASKRGIGILGLTDHNSARNAVPFGALCGKTGILPLFGIEAETREEVHALCLFGSPEAALELGDFLYGLLPDIPNDPARFGDQVWVDEEENILGEEGKLLLQAADIALEDLEEQVLSRGGLFIPAHVDRPSFSLLSQLGFIPDGRYTAIEVTSLPCPPHGAYPCITGSDAHYPDDVGGRAFELGPTERSFSGIAAALREGRLVLPPLPERR